MFWSCAHTYTYTYIYIYIYVYIFLKIWKQLHRLVVVQHSLSYVMLQPTPTGYIARSSKARRQRLLLKGPRCIRERIKVHWQETSRKGSRTITRDSEHRTYVHVYAEIQAAKMIIKIQPPSSSTHVQVSTHRYAVCFTPSKIFRGINLATFVAIIAFRTTEGTTGISITFALTI